MVEENPFTQLYGSIWKMLELWPGFEGLVCVGNRIKFSGENRDPMKKEILTADLPEVRVVPSGGAMNLHVTNKESNIKKSFQIQVSTGDQRVDAVGTELSGEDELIKVNVGLFPVEWEILRALTTWSETIYKLTWKGEEFVKDLSVVGLTEGASQADLNRGIRGWSAVVTIQVDMYFENSVLGTEDEGS